MVYVQNWNKISNLLLLQNIKNVHQLICVFADCKIVEAQTAACEKLIGLTLYGISHKIYILFNERCRYRLFQPKWTPSFIYTKTMNSFQKRSQKGKIVKQILCHIQSTAYSVALPHYFGKDFWHNNKYLCGWRPYHWSYDSQFHCLWYIINCKCPHNERNLCERPPSCVQIRSASVKLWYSSIQWEIWLKSCQRALPMDLNGKRPPDVLGGCHYSKRVAFAK